MSFRFFFCVILSLLIWMIFPGPIVSADCGNPATARELLDCVLKNDPRILASGEQVKRSEALERAAGAWPNPDMDGEAAFAPDGSKGERISASFSQQLDWSGKIGAGAKEARMEYEAQKAEDHLTRQEILAETVLKLVRLRQIVDERELMEGQEKLCESGLERFKKLAFITTEQQTEKQALEWSLERLRLQILDLDSEKEEIQLELSVSMGGGENANWVTIPLKTNWPAWPSSVLKTPSFLLVEKFRMEGAQADVEKEHAASWPTISLGPDFQREGDDFSQRDFWGARLSLGLPLWDQNGGNRDAAEAGLREAKIKESSAETKLALTRRLLKNRYEKSVERVIALEKQIEEADKKLAPIRSGYLNGRVSLSLALEAYRELEEFIQNFHETERTAYESLWRGYTLEDMAESQDP